jgi:hypothetical protein
LCELLADIVRNVVKGARLRLGPKTLEGRGEHLGGSLVMALGK